MKRLLWLLALPLASCAFGPDYHGPPAPETPLPAGFKNANWKRGEPADAQARGSWWSVFHDPALDGYIRTALAGNQDLRVAAARIGEARALARVAAADLYPQVTFNGSAVRRRTTNTGPVQRGQLVGPSPFGGAAAGAAGGAGMAPAAASGAGAGATSLTTQPLSTTFNLFRAPLDLEWEIDLFGRVRRGREAVRAEAESVQADCQNMALSLSANVAVNYFALRAVDSEEAVLESAIRDRREALRIAQERLEAGLTSELDAARASADLAGNEADRQTLLRTRGQLENAFATLLGQPASTLRLSRRPLDRTAPPHVPAGLPSRLLERRPDVASAERQLAAANARIGVAKAAFFPVLKLTGEAGFESADIARLFNWESRVWSLGAQALQPVFEGGRNVANLGAAQARYDEAVATYRARVLRGFQEVEDALSDLRTLAAQAEAESRAVAAARRAHELTAQQYAHGAIGFLDVLEAQRTVLVDERVVAQVQGQRLQATVRLIKALGGDWR